MLNIGNSDLFSLIKSVLLSVHDERGEITSWATGFMLAAPGPTLVTCWHTVTGLDFLNPLVTVPPRPRYLSLFVPEIVKDGSELRLDRAKPVTIELYDKRNGAAKPRWRQQTSARENHDLSALDIFIPFDLDIVFIDVDLPDDYKEPLCINGSKFHDAIGLPMGTQTIVVGYPYGFSVFGSISFPTPVALTRFVAGFTFREFRWTTLLVQAAFPVMSGSPVYCINEKDWILVGIYGGAAFTEHQLAVNLGRDPSKFSDTNPTANLGLVYPTGIFKLANLVYDFAKQNQ